MKKTGLYKFAAHIAVLICLLFSPLVIGQTEEPNRELNALFEELGRAEAQIVKEQQNAYEADPCLKRSINELEKANKLDAKTTKERLRARTTIKNFGEQFNEANQDYLKFRGASGKVQSYTFLQESYNDETLMIIFADLAYYYMNRQDPSLEYPITRAQRDTLIARYSDILYELSVKAEETISTLEQSPYLSEETQQAANNEARYSIAFSLFEQYIRLNKPKVLVDAEKNLKLVYIELSKINPHWNEIRNPN